jgi:hypothetical protein
LRALRRPPGETRFTISTSTFRPIPLASLARNSAILAALSWLLMTSGGYSRAWSDSSQNSAPAAAISLAKRL